MRVRDASFVLARGLFASAITLFTRDSKGSAIRATIQVTDFRD